MRPPWLLSLAVLPWIVVALWNVLDADPILFLYDRIFPVTTDGSSCSAVRQLSQQTVWVTGASSGIGASLVCTLVGAQTKHVVLSSRNSTRLDRVRRECQQRHPGSPTVLSIVRYDATEVSSTKAVVREALEVAGEAGIDVLVLNSGVYQSKPAFETTIDETRRISLVNYEAPVDLSLTLMREDRWKERGYGHVVVSSSTTGKGPHALTSSYGASKAALKNFFQTLSTEEFTWLKVQVLILGGTKTDMWKNLEYNVKEPDDASLMEPDRVAQLIVRAIATPYWWLFYEVWIPNSKSNLTWAYLSVRVCISSPLLHLYCIAKYLNPPLSNFSACISYIPIYISIYTDIGLLYLALLTYTPSLFYFLNHLVGWSRHLSFQQDTSDVLDIYTLLKNLVGAFWTV